MSEKPQPLSPTTAQQLSPSTPHPFSTSSLHNSRSPQPRTLPTEAPLPSSPRPSSVRSPVPSAPSASQPQTESEPWKSQLPQPQAPGYVAAADCLQSSESNMFGSARVGSDEGYVQAGAEDSEPEKPFERESESGQVSYKDKFGVAADQIVPKPQHACDSAPGGYAANGNGSKMHGTGRCTGEGPLNFSVPQILKPWSVEPYDEEERTADPNLLAEMMEAATTVTGDLSAERELEKLQIKTIYALVDFLSVDEQGKDVNKALLFLTNKQAQELDIADHSKLMRALDISPEPKLVINLIDSPTFCHFMMGSSGQSIECHWSMRNKLGRLELEYSPDLLNEYYWISEERGLAGLQENDLKLANFLRSCVLPLAQQNHALVISQLNRCSMSRSFGRICEDARRLNGGDLGFTMLHFANAEEYSIAADTPGCVTYELKQKCSRWKKRAEALRLAQQRSVRGYQMSNYISERMDAPQGCTHFIVTDSVNDNLGKVDWDAMYKLKANFLHQMATALPSLTIATFLTPWHLEGSVHRCFDTVGRGLPLLLLDSRPPIDAVEFITRKKGSVDQSTLRRGSDGTITITGSLNTVIQAYDGDLKALALDYLTDLEDRLHAAGTTNFYHMCTLAFLHSLLVAKHPHRSQATLGGVSEDHSICNIIRLFEKERKANEEEGHTQAENNCATVPDRTEDARALAAVLMQHGQYRLKMMQKLAYKIFDKHQALVNMCDTPEELDHMTQQLSMHGMYKNIMLSLVDIEEVQNANIAFAKYQRFKKMKSAKFFTFKRGMREKDYWVQLVCFTGSSEQVAEGREMIQEIIELMRDKTEEDGPYNGPRDTGLLNASEVQQKVELVLTSKKTFSANLSDLNKLEKMMVQIPNLNRLPETNDLTTMELLRNAWDSIDLYTHEAGRAKIVAKTSYYILLLLGFLITLFTVVNLNQPGTFSPRTLNNIVIGLSLSSSFVAGLITVVNPVTKWQQLRSAALAMESEIWVFRTRSGPYTVSISNNAKDVEDKLHENLDNIRQHVLKSAGIRETSFSSRITLFGDLKRPKHVKVFRHGQYSSSLRDGTYGRSNVDEDDHHSPINPDMYLKLRVEPQMTFYQERMPSYLLSRRASQVLLMLGTIAATLMSTLELSTWAALSTAITAAVTAIAEFNGTDKKLTRYSDTLNNLQQIVMWWRCLPSVDRANVSKIMTLITSCEECFRDEWSSWASTSTANKQLSKAAAAAEAGDSQKKTTDSVPVGNAPP